jgi:hypothetical protein
VLALHAGLTAPCTQQPARLGEPRPNAAPSPPQDLLCPEAVQQLASAAGRLDLQRCGACLEPPCATRGCRKAALELLSELMGESPASLEEGVALLLELHYTRQVCAVSECVCVCVCVCARVNVCMGTQAPPHSL